MKKNIFFDYGRTLVKHPEDGAGLEIVKKTGLTDEKDIEIVRNAIFSVGKYLNFLDEASMERDEYKKLLLNDIPPHLAEYALKAADYHIGELGMIDGMEDLLIKLKKDGFKLYITSNMDKLHVSQMKDIEIMKYFDDAIFSSQIKIRKPFKGFFEKALEQFGVKAQDCLFIDDLEENVEGAKVCGIEGFVFKGNAKDAEDFIYSYNR